MKVEQALRLAISGKSLLLRLPGQGQGSTRQSRASRRWCGCADDEGVIQAPGTFINLAAELGLDRRTDASGAR